MCVNPDLFDKQSLNTNFKKECYEWGKLKYWKSNLAIQNEIKAIPTDY